MALEASLIDRAGYVVTTSHVFPQLFFSEELVLVGKDLLVPRA